MTPPHLTIKEVVYVHMFVCIIPSMQSEFALPEIWPIDQHTEGLV
jgi:hypothetical protein